MLMHILWRVHSYKLECSHTWLASSRYGLVSRKQDLFILVVTWYYSFYLEVTGWPFLFHVYKGCGLVHRKHRKFSTNWPKIHCSRKFYPPKYPLCSMYVLCMYKARWVWTCEARAVTDIVIGRVCVWYTSLYWEPVFQCHLCKACDGTIGLIVDDVMIVLYTSMNVWNTGHHLVH